MSAALARYEVRAVWIHPDRSMSSQSVSHFDRQAMYDRPPNLFGVYGLYGGGVVQDHQERAAAETHCAQLNGGAND